MVLHMIHRTIAVFGLAYGIALHEAHETLRGLTGGRDRHHSTDCGDFRSQGTTQIHGYLLSLGNPTIHGPQPPPPQICSSAGGGADVEMENL